MSSQYLCVKKPLKMEWSCAHNFAAKLCYNYAIFRLKENSWRETKYFCHLVKVSAKW